MTSKNLRIRSEAQEEINSAFEYYFRRNPIVAEAFLNELGSALKQIAAHPQIHSLYTKNTRRCLLERFPYAVVFQEKADVILVVAIAHAKRRPGYWAKRL